MKKYLISLTILLAVSCSDKKVEPSGEVTTRVESLPYYQSADFTPIWFENADAVPADFHRIPDFSFTNQLGETISQVGLKDQITVVDFFFTTCPGICPKMTGNMKLVQDAFVEDEQVQLLSHSVTPDFDQVSVLAAYADRNEVKAGKWHLLTGEREKIYDLARNYYFVEEDMGLLKSPDEFLHTENFILVDQNKHIRGIYNGLNTTSINQLIADIKSLQKN